MNDTRIIFLTSDIWQGIRSLGISLDDVADATPAFTNKISDQDLATLNALPSVQQLTRVLGKPSNMFFGSDDVAWDRFKNIVNPLSETSYIQERIMTYLNGVADISEHSIQVVDLKPGKVIGVIFGYGSLDALKKDNNVLAVLTTIVQKALIHNSVETLMASSCSETISKFITVNLFANSNLPPVAVFN